MVKHEEPRQQGYFIELFNRAIYKLSNVSNFDKTLLLHTNKKEGLYLSWSEEKSFDGERKMHGKLRVSFMKQGIRETN